jgi:hypothetical protein
MSVNEYVTKFTQLSCYAPHEVDNDETKMECYLNGLNDGFAYALETRDFKNFKGMVNKALVLENNRGVMEYKRKLVHQHQSGSGSRPRVGTPTAGPMFRPAQPQSQSRPQTARQIFSTPQRQVIQCPTFFRPLLLGIRIFRGLKLPRTHCKLIVGATTVERRDIMPADAPIRVLVQIRLLQLHLPLPVELSRTTLMGESTMLSWRKPRKLRTLSLVCFLSTTLL